MAEENKVTASEPPRSDTLRLKPVIRKPGEKPDAVEQLKSVTQQLKGLTQQIPQQAIMHKTGIIGDQELTEAQRNAAKAKTARISLSDAIGVSPVKEEPAAPMKTIRIRRPTGIPSASALSAVKPVEESAAAPEQPSPSMTQKKTIKIQRPALMKPSKLGVKKPEAAVEPEGGVADIPDLPEVAAAPAVPRLASASDDTVADVPKGVAIMSLIVQLAASVVMAALAWFLYQDTQISPF